MCLRVTLAILAVTALAQAQPKRVLYVTHSAGFRHSSIPLSASILDKVAVESGKLSLTWTESAEAINAENLRNFDAVLFYTSGELPLTDAQKNALLEFVSAGGGFAGVHSATDTLYGWPRYGELIGGYFDGHPWVQEIRIDVEDPEHPAMAGAAPSFRIMDEIYQFRNLSRERVRVLMALDVSSVDTKASGAHQGTTDFPLAWSRLEGNGRVFYTAFGHFEETWQDPRFQRLMLGALLWTTKQMDADGSPRPPLGPAILGIGNAASMQPPGVAAPGTILSIFGRSLTPGSSGVSAGPVYANKLAGAAVTVNGAAAPLLYAGPGQVNVLLPDTVTGSKATLEVHSAGLSDSAEIGIVSAVPGIFAVTKDANTLIVWATGLGRNQTLIVRVGGRDARVLSANVSPQWPGLYQLNVEIPAAVSGPTALIELQVPGSEHIGRFEARID
jgi:type 1 glutamine amidotransferase